MEAIGIIGQGFVGTAVREGMKNHFQIETYDKFKMDASTCSSLRELQVEDEYSFCLLANSDEKDGRMRFVHY